MSLCLFVYMETIITMKGTILYLVGLNVNIFEAKLLRPREKTNKKTYPEEVPKCVIFGSIFGNLSLAQINIKMHNNALHTRKKWMLGCLHIYTRRWILGWCIN